MTITEPTTITPKTRTAALAVFVEDDCTVTASEVDGWPGQYVVRIGRVVVFHGELDTLARVAAEMAAAVAALRPPTLDEFLTGAVSDCVEGRP